MQIPGASVSLGSRRTIPVQRSPVYDLLCVRHHVARLVSSAAIAIRFDAAFVGMGAILTQLCEPGSLFVHFVVVSLPWLCS